MSHDHSMASIMQRPLTAPSALIRIPNVQAVFPPNRVYFQTFNQGRRSQATTSVKTYILLSPIFTSPG